MIEQFEAIPLLVTACPSFIDGWDEHIKTHGHDLAYVAASAFARHLFALYQAGKITEFPAVAVAIERLHIEGSPQVKEFATIGILEGVQNVWSNNNADPEQFQRFLGPESQRWWLSLNDFWSGKKTYVE